MATLKTCTKCHEILTTDDFYKSKSSKSGFRSWCKKCDKESANVWSRNNRERGREKAREYRIDNPEKAKKASKRWLANHPEKKKEYNARYKEKNKERLNKYYLQMLKNNLQKRLSHNISTSIAQSLRRGKRGYHWEDLTGYTFNDLKRHLEKQFREGMTWQNYGNWHIEHIIPKSAFNFEEPGHIDFKKCWALKNLRPMWAIDNLRKYTKLDKPFQPSLAIALGK